MVLDLDIMFRYYVFIVWRKQATRQTALGKYLPGVYQLSIQMAKYMKKVLKL